MKLAELRKQRGLSQKQLADALNCSQNIISQYENGNRKPSMTQLQKISAYFGISIDELIDETAPLGVATIVDFEPVDFQKNVKEAETKRIAEQAYSLLMKMPPEMQKAAIAQLKALADLNKE